MIVLSSALHWMKIEEAHGRVIRDEIDKFRELFKYWVSTFKRDEFEDEWGLFN